MNFPSSLSDRLPRLLPPHRKLLYIKLPGKIGLSFQKAKFVSDKVGAEEYERTRSEWKKVTWPSFLKAAKEKCYASEVFQDV